jgi:hypothetical protein
MRHGDPSGDRVEQVVVMAVAATGLVADSEAVGQGLEEVYHLVDGADLGAADDRPGLAEDADGDALVVEIESDVEQGCLLKSLDLGNAATGFQVTRLTGASLHSLNTDAPSEVASGPISLDRLSCRLILFAAERLSPSARERVPWPSRPPTVTPTPSTATWPPAPPPPKWDFARAAAW